MFTMMANTIIVIYSLLPTPTQIIFLTTPLVILGGAGLAEKIAGGMLTSGLMILQVANGSQGVHNTNIV